MRFAAGGPGMILAAMAAAVLLVVGAIAAQDKDTRDSIQDFLGYGGPHSDETYGGRDLFHTGADIGGTKSGETYAAYDARRDASGDRDFRGFQCPDQCQVHEAGYRWAASREVTRAGDCKGPTWAFVEGCAAYVFTRTPPER